MVPSKSMVPDKTSAFNFEAYQELSPKLLPVLFVMTASKYKEAGDGPVCSAESSFTHISFPLISFILFFCFFPFL